MKLVLLYGPPAVGKLSVAEVLAVKTSFRVLHNHLFIDPAQALFAFGSPEMAALTRELRAVSLEAARKGGVLGVILTFVYARDRDGYILGLCEEAEAKSDEVCLVRLTCSLETLEARVTEPSRRDFGKLTTVAGLREKLGKLEEPFGSVQGRKSLTLSADAGTPHDSAQKTIQSFGL